MNEYIKNLQVCLDDRLMKEAMYEGRSIVDLHILYHHYVIEVSNLYRIPQEHYSKIMVLAFNKTIKKH